jgi:outer membrane protein assembly factor BamB
MRRMRKISSILAAVLLAAGAAAPAVAAAPAARWGQDGYGPGHTRYNPDESVVNAGSIGKLKQRWTATAGPGEPGCEPATRAPLMVDNRVFILDSGGVGAYDARTGKRLWLAADFSFISAGLAVAGGVVLVSDTNCYSNSNYDGHVTALDVRTGAELWRATGSWMIDTVVADAGAVVTSGYCGTCEGFKNGVVAFRLSDGAELWSRENVVLAGPVAAGGRVLLSRTGSAETQAVAIATGVPAWGFGGRVGASAATPAGDQFYVTDAGGLRAVHAKSGTQLWRIDKETGDLAADGRRVYVAAAGRMNTYDAKSGKLLWTRALSRPRTPVRAGGLLYVVTGAGIPAILSPANGKPANGKPVPHGMTQHVVVAGGQLLATYGSTLRVYAP